MGALGTKVADAYVEIRTDTSKAESEVRKQAHSLGATFASVFGAAAFGAAMRKSIDAASDLNETVSKSKQMFGSASGEMEKYAASAAKSMGMSKRAYLDAASGLKGLLDNLGLASGQSTKWSREMTQLGADLASFFNTDPADAVAAIGSALRGESEPIRAYNVNINDALVKTKAFEMGLYSGKGAIEQSAKAQATLALIVQQTAAAHGDFARTADGVANSQRIAKAETENAAASMGQNFLPIYERAVQVVGFLAEGFGALPGPVQIALVALAGFVAIQGPLGKVGDAVDGLSRKFTNLGSNSQTAFIGIGVALTTMTIGLTLRANELKKHADAITASIQEMSTAATDKEAAAAFVQAITDMVASGQHAGDMMAYLAATNLEGAKRVLDMGAASGIAAEGLAQLAAAVEEEERKRAQAAATAAEYGATMDAATIAQDANRNSFPGLIAQIQAYKASVGATTFEMKSMVDELVKTKSGYLNAQGAVANLRARMADANATTLDQAQALSSAEGAVVDYINQLGNIPPEKKTRILALLNAGNYNAVAAALAEVTKARVVPVIMEIRQGTMPAVQQASYASAKSFAAAFVSTANDELTSGAGGVSSGGAAVGHAAGQSAAQAAADAAKAAADAMDSEMANKFETGAISAAAYDKYLRERLKHLKKFSDEWIAVWREIHNVEEDAARKTDDTMANKFEAGAISKAAYDKYLRERLKHLKKFSDEWMAVWREIQKLEEKPVKTPAKDPKPTPSKVVPGDYVTDDGITVHHYARGGVFNRKTFGIFGEAGPEAILPLSRPRELAGVLSDPRVAAAVGGAAGGVSIGTVNVGSRQDFGELERVVDRIAWRVA